jgi:hypothetical protein
VRVCRRIRKRQSPERTSTQASKAGTNQKMGFLGGRPGMVATCPSWDFFRSSKPQPTWESKAVAVVEASCAMSLEFDQGVSRASLRARPGRQRALR